MEEPGRADHLLELAERRAGERGRVGVPREQPGRDQVDALVGALGGEDGGDQELERVAVVERGGGVGVEPRQDLDHRLDARGIGRREAAARRSLAARDRALSRRLRTRARTLRRVTRLAGRGARLSALAAPARRRAGAILAGQPGRRFGLAPRARGLAGHREAA